MPSSSKPFGPRPPQPPGVVVVLDTETTGFANDLDTRCLQLGAVAYDRQTLTKISQFSVLVAPDVWSVGADQAVSIHGITQEFACANGLSQKDAWDKWTTWLQATLPAGIPAVLAAWNSQFDATILREWHTRLYGTTTAPWPSWKVAGRYEAKLGCLMTAYRAWMPSNNVKGSAKLTVASQVFGLGAQADIHDALKDAQMAADVWVAMENRG